jgi:translation initiation factor IF-2
LRRIAAERKAKPITVQIPESITVGELASRLKATVAEVIKKLMANGIFASINDEIDFDTASLVAMEFHAKVEKEVEVTIEEQIIDDSDDKEEDLVPRAPVVVVMGHVDHGKTSLLDAIRHTNVTESEAGGITQHIGAYQVNVNGRMVTFLDTPGHEAFTTMRARGAMATDIAVLVVAADDGVMPQTIEAIHHAKAAKVSIIVAINKMDKPGANPQHVMEELTKYDVVPEEWGGNVPCIRVSAKQKTGIKDLLEMILLVTDMKELKANPNRAAKGVVIEARLDKGRGPIATMLVQNGTLHTGDILVAGTSVGRVRAMANANGKPIQSAKPSVPVEITGLDSVPTGGDTFNAVTDEKLARHIASRRQTKKREDELKTTTRISLEDLFQHIKEGQIKELGIIVKADVQGSVEALRQSLERLNTGEVKVNIIHGGVGAITETDIMLASASNAIIIGFNVRPDVNARKAAETEKVDVRLYRVIYDAIEDVKAAMSGLLDPEYREVTLGRAEIRKIFRASRIGTIAGCYVMEGKIERDAGVRVVRDGIVIHEGKLDSLKRFKDDVKEVVQGYECGLALEKYNEIQEGDVIEVFNTEAIKRELS